MDHCQVNENRSRFELHGLLMKNYVIIFFLGTGALVAPLIEATGRSPIVVGKPHQTMLDIILKR